MHFLFQGYQPVYPEKTIQTLQNGGFTPQLWDNEVQRIRSQTTVLIRYSSMRTYPSKLGHCILECVKWKISIVIIVFGAIIIINKAAEGSTCDYCRIKFSPII